MRSQPAVRALGASLRAAVVVEPAAANYEAFAVGNS